MCRCVMIGLGPSQGREEEIAFGIGLRLEIHVPPRGHLASVQALSSGALVEHLLRGGEGPRVWGSRVTKGGGCSSVEERLPST